MSDILLSLNFIVSLLFICCISSYSAQNATISSPLAPYELEAFEFSNPNDSTSKFYLIWDRPFYFLPSNHISNEDITKNANHLLLHQFTLPQPEETQPNQSYQIAGNKPVQSEKNDQHLSANHTNPVDKGLTCKGQHSSVETKIGLFDDVHEYIIEYKLHGSEEESTIITVDKDVTWVCLEGLATHTFYSIYVSANYSSYSVRSAEYLLDTTETDSSKTNDCSCHPLGVYPGGEKCDLNSIDICQCQEGYAGLFCHQCKHLFYEKDGHCIPCPCKSKLKSLYCTLVEDEPVCCCKKGYTGKDCRTCDNGYFLYYQTCAPCNCNGNVDLNSPEICNPISGECKHCLNNTAGFTCHRCLPGYNGDPIRYKSCTYAGLIKAKPIAPMKTSKLSGGLIFAISLVCFLLVLLTVCLYYHRVCFKIKSRRSQPKDDQAGVKFSDMNNQEFDESNNAAYSSGFRMPGQQRGMPYSPLKECV